MKFTARMLTFLGALVALADEGKTADGYEALLAGLRRAEEARDDGEPWGDELVGHWQYALDHYAEQHRIGRA
jgi:hypothetical protein